MVDPSNGTIFYRSLHTGILPVFPMSLLYAVSI